MRGTRASFTDPIDRKPSWIVRGRFTLRPRSSFSARALSHSFTAVPFAGVIRPRAAAAAQAASAPRVPRARPPLPGPALRWRHQAAGDRGLDGFIVAAHDRAEGADRLQALIERDGAVAGDGRRRFPVGVELGQFHMAARAAPGGP